MLKAAIDYGKKVIFTSDNSRFESFWEIYSDATNNNEENKVIAIEDRRVLLKIFLDQPLKVIQKIYH